MNCFYPHANLNKIQTVYLQMDTVVEAVVALK